MRTERFDAVFVTIHPTYPALVGAMLKRSVGLPFVLDYQDPWVGAWGQSVGPASNGRPDLKSRASRFVATRLEPMALRAADAVTAVSRATYEQALARTPEARPLVVDELPVGWDRRDFDVLDRIGRMRPPPKDDVDDVVRICYVGTLWPAAIQTLRAVFEAAASVRTTDARGARLRLHFVGTSSQRGSETLPAAIPLAKEFGLEAIVSECAARVDYFEALQLLRDSSAILLIGSDEPHYTPSKVFSVLCSERPVLAVLHEASTGTELLRRAARAPTMRLVTFDQAHPVRTRVQAIAFELQQLLADPRYRTEDIDLAALEPMSAPALARRLAGVFDRVVSKKDARR